MNGSSIRRFWTSPYFTAITGVCTIVGFVLAIYFYFASIRRPDVVYCVPTSRTIVADPTGTSALRLEFNGQIVNTRVTGLQLVFWNAGREAVRENGILETVRVRTTPAVPILEARIRRTTRSVCGIALNTANAARGEIEVSWRILEQNDGGEIQLIYAGGTDVSAQASGTLEGQRSLRSVDYSVIRPTKSSGWILTALAILIGGGFTVFNTYDFFRTYEPRSRFRRFIAIGVAVLLVTAIIIGFAGAFVREIWPQATAPSPPFRF